MIMPAITQIKNLRVLRPLLSRYYDHRFATNKSGQLFRGVFHSANEAVASAPAMLPIGYDQPAAAAMYRDRLEDVSLSDYPVLYWLRLLVGNANGIFDYGGHVGIKYYSYRKYLPFPAEFVWTVCDVPHVARAGADLARERGEEQRLRFVTDFSEVAGRSILFCSGSLQYIEEHLDLKLERVSNRPPHVVINDAPFGQGPTFFTLNSIGTALCPYKIQNREEFLTGMQRLGYELVDQWTIPNKTCIVPLHPERSVYEYSGLYLRLRG